MSSPEEHCIACNRMNYKSHFRLEFRGRPYDPNTYEPLPTVKQKRREEPRNERPPKQKQRNELVKIAHKRLHRKGPILPMKERLVRKKIRSGPGTIFSLVLIARNDLSCTDQWLIGVSPLVPYSDRD